MPTNCESVLSRTSRGVTAPSGSAFIVMERASVK